MTASPLPPASGDADGEAPSAAGGAAHGAGQDQRTAAIDALERSFSDLITAFRRHVAKAAETASPGVLPGTYKVLSTLHRTGPVTLSALAEILAADKGMLSRSVSELETLKFVERTADPRDKRSRLIAVTRLGDERLEAARGPRGHRLFAALEDWSLSDIEHVTKLLRALTRGESPDTD